MLLEKKEVEKVNRTAFKDRVGELKKDRNLFFWIALLLAGTTIYQSYSVKEAIEKSQNTTEVVWVKLLPDGSHKISQFTPDNEQPIYTPTVNSLLSKYVQKRYGQLKETIERDYAEAAVFMSPVLTGEFADPKGFNVAQKVVDIQADMAAKRIYIEIKDIDHYDAIEGQFDGDVKPVIRTLVTYQEITRDYQGKEISSVQQMRRLQWTLLQRNELSKQSLDWLNINPLGIQIIDDKSVQQ
ncbi:TPA: hypothetical protein QDV07_004486 [Escherichia coli]|uniref:VirB8/TrbF family protein n=2 Tax=Escherichia coli TaxID=562 RepID=UPI00038FC1A9|nr:VirB8/TrbF family protein [Escherichia coli]EQX73257.1 hypothetical protein G935_04108 [Escherichia coli UMEA 3190-1]HDS0347984.1 hypothetical protein [Escherichia coli]